jgi:methyl-accepting chemotaxis protein
MKTRTRKHYFINKKLQLKYIILTMSLLVLFTIILLSVIIAPYVIALFSDIPLSRQNEAATFLLTLNNNSTWIGIALSILLFGILSIFITHKIAGPLVRFERLAESIADGNMTTRIKLRKGDDLHKLAEGFNQMADNLESLLVSIDMEQKKLSSHITDLRRELTARNISEQTVQELATKIDADKDDISKILKTYNYRTQK